MRLIAAKRDAPTVEPSHPKRRIHMSDPINPDTSPPRPPRKRKGLLIASAVVGTLVILAGTKAYVFAKGIGGHHGWGGPMSAEFVADHIEHGVKYVLSD